MVVQGIKLCRYIGPSCMGGKMWEVRKPLPMLAGANLQVSRRRPDMDDRRENVNMTIFVSRVSGERFRIGVCWPNVGGEEDRFR